MSVPPESLAVGKCYLADRGLGPRICRILEINPDVGILYEHRPPGANRWFKWRQARTGVQIFAEYVMGEVSPDWTPEREK